MKKHLNVVAAIIIYNGRILCMQRGDSPYPYTSHKYEFPGGKVEPGEAKHAALERELREEMAIEVNVKESDLFMSVEYKYPDFSLTLSTFLCRVSSPDFIRKEHIASKWLRPAELDTLAWAPADYPVTEKLSKMVF